VSANALDSSEGFFLRDDLLRFDLALLEDLAARLRRWVVLRALLFATGEPPMWRL
jgi:hypothetical protein